MKQIGKILAFLFLCPALALCQSGNMAEMSLELNIQEVAKVGFYSNYQFLTFDNATIDGQSSEQVVTPITGQTWLNYSSIVKEGVRNYISACITDANVPAETTIRLRVGPDAGEGMGATGIPVKEIQLTYEPQNIITEIGSCYTGKGIGKGHMLNYIWDRPTADESLFFDDSQYEVSVTYTIAAAE